MPFFALKKKLSEKVFPFFNHPEITATLIEQEFTTPPNAELGHIALPCFRAAKLLSKPPGKISQEIASQFKDPTLTVSAAGPYVNFKWNTRELYQKTLPFILKEGNRYGADSAGAKKEIIIEYCSPNIAKPLFFHHIRSTLIGNTLANVYDFLGYKTERMNYVGDWGSQFARLLCAFELWGDRKKLSLADVPATMAHLLEVYVRFHKEIETKPEYKDKANDWLRRMESGDTEAMALWKLIREISVASMENTLKRLQVSFDFIEGESTYTEDSEKVLEEVKKKADGKISEGAWIVEVPGITTPALIQKKDGTTLYITRDIAAAMDRHKRFSFEKSYYVVSEQQKLHFQQLFGVLKKMGHAWSDKLEHLSFGTVLFNSERMSTREGRAIYLDDVLNEAKALALVECTQKNPDLKNKEEVAEMVGIGAVIFGSLSSNKQRDINFDWKIVLALDGETGPYVQYSLVRCQSILEKAKEKNVSEDISGLEGYTFAHEEDALIFTLSKFRSVLHQVITDNEPYHLPRYLIDVAKAYNRFYYQLPVLQATDPLQRAVRLSLVRGTKTVLTNGLKLLGISCPTEM